MTFRAKKKNKKSPSSAEEMKKSIDCQTKRFERLKPE